MAVVTRSTEKHPWLPQGGKPPREAVPIPGVSKISPPASPRSLGYTPRTAPAARPQPREAADAFSVKNQEMAVTKLGSLRQGAALKGWGNAAGGAQPAQGTRGGKAPVRGPGRNQCKFIKAFICSWYDQEWDSDLLYNLIQLSGTKECVLNKKPEWSSKNIKRLSKKL